MAFFATSNGKGPYDGIGGTIKREASKASLRRPLWNQIQTPTDLFDFCQENIRGIETYYVTDMRLTKPMRPI